MESIEFTHQLAALEPALLRFTKRFVKSQEDSKDLVQETILKALSYKASFRQNKNLSGWLFIIMRNTFINQYRKQAQSRNNIVIDTQSLLRGDGRTVQTADETTFISEVWKAIDSISLDIAKPFKMYLSGYKYDEIATELNIPVGTVKSRIFLARQEIRSQLPGYR